jgi:hypothetical protein
MGLFRLGEVPRQYSVDAGLPSINSTRGRTQVPTQAQAGDDVTDTSPPATATQPMALPSR